MSLAITGTERNAKTGQPPIVLSDGDMQTIRAMQAKGFGRQTVPANALAELSRFRRSHALDIGQMTRGQRWEHWKATADYHLKGGGGPEVQQQLARDQLAKHERLLIPGDVHSDQFLTNVAVQYGNDMFIGDDLCPTVIVAKETGTIPSWGQRDRMQTPDDTLGPYGHANEIVETRDGVGYVTVGRGLRNKIAVATVANQDAPYDELLDLTESVMELMQLAREIRQATVLTTAGNYGANTAAVAAADRWNTATGGDPIANMQTADAALWTGRGASDKFMFSDLDIYNVLSRHPDILSLFVFSGGGTPGLATPDMIARWLGADRYLIGRARQDTANEGATASYSRIWPSSWGLVRVPRGRATLRNAWFASTLRWAMTGVSGATNGWRAIQWLKEEDGVGGVYWAQVTTQEVSQVIAALCGYLWTTPIN